MEVKALWIMRDLHKLTFKSTLLTNCRKCASMKLTSTLFELLPKLEQEFQIYLIEIRIKLILFCYETGEPKNDNLEIIHLEYQKANFM